MIITEKVWITINNKNIKNLIDKEYNVDKINSKIEIFVKDLQISSNVVIEVVCKNCGKINKIKYNKYNRLKNGYYCINCINVARSISVFNKYGVDNVSKVKEIIEKKKIIITTEIKEKRKQTNIEKYGVDNPMKNSNIKERAKLKNIEKYGVDNPMKVSLIKNKMKETKIKNGNQVPDELLDSYLLYRRNVDNNTDTKELFNNWDGYDYYDGEYIKNNNINYI